MFVIIWVRPPVSAGAFPPSMPLRRGNISPLGGSLRGNGRAQAALPGVGDPRCAGFEIPEIVGAIETRQTSVPMSHAASPYTRAKSPARSRQSKDSVCAGAFNERICKRADYGSGVILRDPPLFSGIRVAPPEAAPFRPPSPLSSVRRQEESPVRKRRERACRRVKSHSADRWDSRRSRDARRRRLEYGPRHDRRRERRRAMRCCRPASRRSIAHRESIEPAPDRGG